MNRAKAVKQLRHLRQLVDKEERLAAQLWDQEWKTLIATLLSARTRDDVTIPVAEQLFKEYPTVQALAQASLQQIETAIKSVNFYKTKAKRVKECAQALEELNGVPHELDKLLKLPGVGRKTANVFLSEIGKEAIGVDTHVARIAKKLDWTKHTNPEKIEADLQKLFPKHLWSSINDTLVRIGRQYKDEVLNDYL